MRRPARDLVLAILAPLFLGAGGIASAQSVDVTRSLRDLDGAQFLEDEPIWICDPTALLPSASSGKQFTIPWWFVGTEASGDSIEPTGRLNRAYLDYPFRAVELARLQGLDPRPELHPLDVGEWGGGGLRAGAYEIIRLQSPMAAFRVVAPRGSELSTRAALARAARLSRSSSVDDQAQAARLYESVLERYPRTSYVTSIYAGLWRVRAHTRAYATDPGAWLDRIFATFHDTCFGVWALDRFMADVPAAESRPLLRRLVGLYPDTKLARAAGAYL